MLAICEGDYQSQLGLVLWWAKAEGGAEVHCIAVSRSLACEASYRSSVAVEACEIGVT